MMKNDWVGGAIGAVVGAASAYLLTVDKFTDFGVRVGDHLLPDGSSILERLLGMNGGYNLAINNADSVTDWTALSISMGVGVIVGAFFGLLSVGILRAVNRSNR